MNRLLTKLYQISIAVIILIAGVTFERTGLIELLSDPYEYPVIMELFIQHLYMVTVSMIFATIIGVTAGIVLTRKRFRRYAGICMYIIGLGQTIPSLAVLALAMSFLGYRHKTGDIRAYHLFHTPHRKKYTCRDYRGTPGTDRCRERHGNAPS